MAADIAKRIAAGSRDVFGVMLESFLMAGAQVGAALSAVLVLCCAGAQVGAGLVLC